MFKILQVIPNLTDGGAERFVVDLSNELVSRSHSVLLCSLFEFSKTDSFFLPLLNQQIEVVSLNKKLGFDWRLILKFRKLINTYQPDIIHTHLRSINYLGLSLPFLKKQNVIHTVHNDARKEAPGKWENNLRTFFFKRLKVTPVTISTESHQSFMNYYNAVDAVQIDNGRIFPVKTSRFEATRDYFETLRKKKTKFYVNIGRIAPQKNQLMLVKSFKKFLDEGHDAVLLLIGTGRERFSESILDEMKAYFSDRIIWLGGKDNVTDYLYLADFFVLSSLHEGMPISLLEAMACKAVPVCTPVGGIPEMVGEEGFLSKSVKEDDFLEALRKSFQTDDLENRANLLLDKYKNKYSIESCADSYLELYGKLLN